MIEAICAKAKELLMKESNVVHIAAPVTVVGDIHGQFFDMLEIFKIGGFCPNTNYLFLGKLGNCINLESGRTVQLTCHDFHDRRLRGPWFIQHRNNFPSCLFKVTIPSSRASYSRKPRVSRCHAVLRILY